MHCKNIMKQQGVNAIELDHFSASTAKWRYETVVRNMNSLLFYRRMCEQVFRREHFANAQNKTFLTESLTACHNPEL